MSMVFDIYLNKTILFIIPSWKSSRVGSSQDFHLYFQWSLC